MCREFTFHTISFLKAINWEQLLFTKETKSTVWKLNQDLRYSYKGNAVAVSKTQRHLQDLKIIWAMLKA